MDFQMADDDLDSPRGMTNGQHPAVRCPMRSSTEGAAAPASSQFGWNHAPQFGGQQVPYGHIGMGYYSQPQYWGQGQQNSQGGGQPYHSQQTRSSASPNNSPYGTPERNHGQSQFGHQARVHNQSTTNAGTDGSRPQLPRFSSQPPPIVSSSSGQGAQHTGSLTSSPAHNSGPSPWPVMPQQFTHGFQAQMQPYQSQGPYQFGDSLPPSNPSRYLPHPSMAPFNTTTGRPFGAHRHTSQNNPHERLRAQHPAYAVPSGNLRHSQWEPEHQMQPRSPAPAIPYGDSEDDSEGDDDEEDDDTDPSPPRHERSAASRVMSPDTQGLIEQGRIAQARERQRAARRAQLLSNAKTVAHPEYIANLKKVDVKTLTDEELVCMICYNKFGIKNADGHIENAVRLDKCKHIMGESCLKKWFEDSDSCPYCRDKVPGIQKSRAKHYRPGGGESPTSRALDALYRRYGNGAHLPAEHREAMEILQDRRLFGSADDGRRHSRSEYDTMHRTVREQQDRLSRLLEASRQPAHSTRIRQPSQLIPEHRDTYERYIQRRAAEETGAAGSMYVPRTVPQAERRRQARIRTANRGANAFTADIQGNVGRHAGIGNPFLPVVDGAEASRRGAIIAHHSANSSLDSTSNVGPRSITPHPTVLDGTANASLNPAAPAWNGMTQGHHQQRQSMVGQLQPSDSPNDPMGALFGYYREVEGHSQGQRQSMPATPTHGRSMSNETNQNPGNQGNNYGFTVINGNVNNGSPSPRGGALGEDRMPAWQAAAGAAGALAGAAALAAIMNDDVYPRAGWEMDVEMPDLRDESF